MFYQKIQTYSPFKYRFVYLDTMEYLSELIFHKNNIDVSFEKIFQKGKLPYVVIICKFKKKDLKKFEKSMEDLRKRCITLGYKDYDQISTELNKVMSKIKEE